MTITADSQIDEPAPPTAHRRRLGLWIALGVVLALVVAGAITATVWYRHYADAPSLDVQGGEFSPVSTGPGYRNVQLGSIDVAEFQQEVNRDQGFTIWVHNPSSVTQTILGLQQGTGPTAEHDRLLVGMTDPSTSNSDGPFTTSPVDVPPHQYRAVRFLTRTSQCFVKSQASTYTELFLRVRVGGFTRSETVPFDSEITVVIDARHATC